MREGGGGGVKKKIVFVESVVVSVSEMREVCIAFAKTHRFKNRVQTNVKRRAQNKEEAVKARETSANSNSPL